MKGATEDEMVGLHWQLNGHKFEQTPGDSEGQGSLVCCSPWGRKELGMTEVLSDKYIISNHHVLHSKYIQHLFNNHSLKIALCRLLF